MKLITLPLLPAAALTSCATDSASLSRGVAKPVATPSASGEPAPTPTPSATRQVFSGAQQAASLVRSVQTLSSVF